MEGLIYKGGKKIEWGRFSPDRHRSEYKRGIVNKFFSNHFGKLLLIIIWIICGAYVVIAVDSSMLIVPIVATIFYTLSH